MLTVVEPCDCASVAQARNDEVAVGIVDDGAQLWVVGEVEC